MPVRSCGGPPLEQIAGARVGVLLRGLVRVRTHTTRIGVIRGGNALTVCARFPLPVRTCPLASPSYDKNRYYCPATTPLPDGVSTEHGEGKPIDAFYFANRLCVEAGRDSLSFSRIREGARR